MKLFNTKVWQSEGAKWEDHSTPNSGWYWQYHVNQYGGMWSFKPQESGELLRWEAPTIFHWQSGWFAQFCSFLPPPSGSLQGTEKASCMVVLSCSSSEICGWHWPLFLHVVCSLTFWLPQATSCTDVVTLAVAILLKLGHEDCYTSKFLQPSDIVWGEVKGK